MGQVQRVFNHYWAQLTWAAAITLVLGLVSEYGLHNSTLTMGWFVLTTLIAGLPILAKAVGALQARTISIELLVSIAVFGAFIINETEEAAMVTFLFMLGTYLEQRTLNKTRSAIKGLTQMAPTTAIALTATGQTEVAVDDIEPQDRLLVRTGDQIPVDGVVLSGETAINEAVITGEAALAVKRIGDPLYMGTFNEQGPITMQATKSGDDSTFSKIIDLVEEAQDTKAPLARFIDQFAKYYTPAVLVIAAVVLLVLRDLRLAITILVLACPGALVIGAPVSNVAGIGRGAKAGILLKGGAVMNALAHVDTALFDKTGTLTMGTPSVSAVKTYADGDQWLGTLGQLEAQTSHPLGQAVLTYLQDHQIPLADTPLTAVSVTAGIGLQAQVQGHLVQVGSPRILTDQPLATDQNADLKRLQAAGASVVLLTVDGALKLLLGIQDQIRPGVAETLTQLKQHGIKRLVMLTGDNPATAQQVAKQIGIDDVQAGMLPDEKAAYLKDQQDAGHRVLFVGDGINDSPALTLADVGIAMGNGTDTAIETSDVVLTESHFDRLAAAQQLSQKTVINTIENIVIAVGTVALLMAGLVFGIVNMASGMLVHELSILIVIVNAMRLLQLRLA